MAQLFAYLNFNGNCKEAMTFYQNVFGGEIQTMSAGDSPAAGDFGAHNAGKLIHAELNSGKLRMMASDWFSPQEYTIGNAMTINVDCESEEEIRSIFSKLSEGGTIIDPLQDTFWNALFGVCKDKYGFSWSCNFQKGGYDMSNPPQ